MNRRKFIKKVGLGVCLLPFVPTKALGCFVDEEYEEFVIAHFIKRQRIKISIERYLVHVPQTLLQYFFSSETRERNDLHYPNIIKFPTKKEAIKFVLDGENVEHRWLFKHAYIKNLRTSEPIPMSEI